MARRTDIPLALASLTALMLAACDLTGPAAPSDNTCSAIAPQGAILLNGSSTIPVTGTSCTRGGEPKILRGYSLVLPTPQHVQFGLSNVAIGDSIIITNAARTDTVESAGPRLTGSGGSFYWLLSFTTELPAGDYVVWVMRDGAPTIGTTLSSTVHAMCEGATINRSIAIGDSLATAHTSASCLIDGTYAEGWEFTTADSTRVSFLLLPNSLTIPHLKITDSAMTTAIGVAAYSDHLMLDAMVPPGNWRVWVTSPPATPVYPTGLPSPPSGYPFTLKRVTPAAPCGPATTPIVVDTSVAGSIGLTDCVIGSSGAMPRVDQYTFTVPTAGTFKFSISASFWPVHFLRASNDSVVMFEYATGSPSLETTKTLAAGTYTYVVRTPYTGTGGTYTATVTIP